MTGTHDLILVALSILIAVAASYTALDLATRVKASTSWAASSAWLATAAVCMGGGIWSMHFVAMLAYVLPGMEIAYDPALTGVSLMVAIVVTGGGFAVVSRPHTGPLRLVLSGLFMGSGILVMHYTGMAAMRMQATLSYDAFWVSVSIFIAIGAAIAALWLAFRSTRFIEKGVAACCMGLAVSGMHFAGMQAASFGAHEMLAGSDASPFVSQSALALSVAAITFLILLSAIVAAMFDRRFAVLVENEARALKASEEQFRSLYRRTPLPLHALDEQGRIEEVSDEWLALMGYGRHEVLGRPLINFMTEESARQRVQQDWPRLIAEGELREKEYRFVNKDGRFLDVLSTSTVERAPDGAFKWAVGGLVDVTERKRTEAALRQAQKMEAVGQLTGGIAHDFNNLLAVIIGSLGMLKKRLSPDERMQRLVDNALEGAKRGAALTERMLAFARRQNLEPRALEIPALVKGMQDLLERSLGPRMTIHTGFPLSLPQVKADPNQLEMALLNLVVNARDAMAGEGAITISADRESDIPAALVPGNYVCLRVADTGEGMDEQTLLRAQEPFFTTKGVGKGTGLGLSMVAGFAEQSGGTLVIHSRKGQGTTMEIWLPVAEENLTAQDVRASPPAQDRTSLLKGCRVLVVDDDALVLWNTQSMLEEMGADVVATSSPLQALDVVQAAEKLDCVVTDYAMPGMSGAQLAAAIRVRLPELPIIIATGYADVSAEVSQYRKVQKPFNEEALGNVILESLRPNAQVVPLDARGRTI
ncbi:MAG TPA: MHYT domain-containing protein [Pseudorhizobium sp.]|nr:MHYT domain-containing protein [Pseudorhizobium sp.]